MFGKHFASAYTGSLVGKGPDVFAVLGYVIAHTRDSHVELNPTVLAAAIGTTAQHITDAISILCAPDPKSRNKDRQGRRLVHVNGFLYFVVSFEKYRAMRSEEDRNEYMRKYMRDRRKKQGETKERKQQGLTKLTRKPRLAQAETETETETEKLFPSLEGNTPNGTRADPTDPPARKGTKKERLLARLTVITEEASAAYNETLAKPKGLLPAVRMTIGKDRRRAHVKRSLQDASDICLEIFGSEKVTREFWDSYFGSCSKDDFLSGRRPGGKGHENWKPDFEYLTKRDVMLRVFDREVSE